MSNSSQELENYKFKSKFTKFIERMFCKVKLNHRCTKLNCLGPVLWRYCPWCGRKINSNGEYLPLKGEAYL